MSVQEQDPLSLECLNDDCLAEVFKYLDWKELLIVDRISSRFQTSVNRSLLKNANKLGKKELKKMTKEEFIRISPFLRTLKICGWSWEDQIARTSIIDNVNPNLFQNLKELHLIDIDVDDNVLIELLNLNENRLECLTINICTKLNGSFLQALKSLKRVVFSRLEAKPTDFIDFLRENKTIESLGLICCDFLNEDCASEIAESLSKLHSLRWVSFESRIDFNQNGLKVAQMKSLRNLELTTVKYSEFPLFLRLVAETNSVERLELNCNSLDLQPLTQMTSLKELILWTDVVLNFNMEVVYQIKSLEFLSFHFNNELEPDFVLNLVQNLPKLKRLELGAYQISWREDNERLETFLRLESRNLNIVMDKFSLLSVSVSCFEIGKILL